LARVGGFEEWEMSELFRSAQTDRRNTKATISIKSNEGAFVITSNDGHPGSASAVLEVSATNPEYNQPVLRIKQAGERGGAASIRIEDPNPDMSLSRPIIFRKIQRWRSM
jgi:hypothetical protein